MPKILKMNFHYSLGQVYYCCCSKSFAKLSCFLIPALQKINLMLKAAIYIFMNDVIKRKRICCTFCWKRPTLMPHPRVTQKRPLQKKIGPWKVTASRSNKHRPNFSGKIRHFYSVISYIHCHYKLFQIFYDTPLKLWHILCQWISFSPHKYSFVGITWYGCCLSIGNEIWNNLSLIRQNGVIFYWRSIWF